VTEIAAKPLYMDVSIRADSEYTFDLPTGHTARVYVFEGSATFGIDESGNGTHVSAVKMLVLGDGDRLRIRTASGENVRFMLMAGAPFEEPIVPYGPFVMNTREEIQQALVDLRNGTFVR
jgi:quercetin 2,3-dioxygenase